jgi:ketosteroid isomerase-like protein
MEPIVSTLLEVLDAFNQEDFDTLARRVDAHVVYRIPGRMPFSGEHHGVDAVTDAFRQLRERSGGSLSVQPDVILTDDEHVMFTARVTGQHAGRALDVVNAYSYRIHDGKLVEGQVFPGDLHAVEAFFPI